MCDGISCDGSSCVEQSQSRFLSKDNDERHCIDPRYTQSWCVVVFLNGAAFHLCCYVHVMLGISA